MDQNKETPNVLDYAALAVFVGTAAFGTYQLGKLGYDWTREGIRTFKNKKNQKEN